MKTVLRIFALCAACFCAGWLLHETPKQEGPIVARGSLAGYQQHWYAPTDSVPVLFYVIPADSIEVIP